jgi:hypothetical protein
VSPLPTLPTDASGMLLSAPSPLITNSNESASGGASASGMDASNDEQSAAFSNSPAGIQHNGGTPRAGTPTAAGRGIGDGRITPPLHPRMPTHGSHPSLSGVVAAVLAQNTSGGASAAANGLAASASVDTGLAQHAAATVGTGSMTNPAAAAVAAVNFVRRVSRAHHDAKTPQARAFDRRHPPLINWIQIPRADRATMKVIGKHFKLSDKQVDDVLSLDQLPSVDGYDNNLCFVFHMQGLCTHITHSNHANTWLLSMSLLHSIRRLINRMIS